jgi:hypothetical protein
LTEEQAALENVDSQEEKEYGEQKRKERIAIVKKCSNSSRMVLNWLKVIKN